MRIAGKNNKKDKEKLADFDKEITRKGFTLIELLIVIGIISILAAAVIVIITPGERLLLARESTRASHMVSVGTAFHMTVAEDDKCASIEDFFTEGDCTGCTVIATGDWYEFNSDCSVAVGLGESPPADPHLRTFYQLKPEESGGVTRLRIRPPAEESEWYPEGRLY